MCIPLTWLHTFAFLSFHSRRSPAGVQPFIGSLYEPLAGAQRLNRPTLSCFGPLADHNSAWPLALQVAAVRGEGAGKKVGSRRVDTAL